MPVGPGFHRLEKPKRSGQTRLRPAAAWCSTFECYFAGAVLAGAGLLVEFVDVLVFDLW
jgi:hypothetical protein